MGNFTMEVKILPGELGHTIVETQMGVTVGCGNQGCLEAYAGAKNIVERTHAKIEIGQQTILTRSHKGR